MATITVKRFNNPDERRPFVDHGEADIVDCDGELLGLGNFEPGWRWSQDVKPIAGTKSCEVEHFGYVLSGRMRVRMDDGAETEISAGDVVHIPGGHDAWVVGDDTCRFVDWGMGPNYAKRAGAPSREAPRPEARH